MSYSDAEMMMATQVAYLNTEGHGSNIKQTVGELVDTILHQYGTYDRTTGTYTIKNGIGGAEKAQFETAQKMMAMSEQNNVVSWRHWTVVDSCNYESTTGYRGCLIDTGDGNAIVGCRGSESYNPEASYKDWVVADLGRLNNEQTSQQNDAAAYTKYLYEKYGNNYDAFSFTGHSLGGSLATHAAITAPEGMQKKIDKVISYDGPGFSDEYLKKFGEKIQKIKEKIYHYEYSWVGSLLNQPEGINNRIIKAHDDKNQSDPLFTQLFRHDTPNIEFDENGNVMDGERGPLQKYMGPFSKYLENSPILFQITHSFEFLALLLNGLNFSIIEHVIEDFEEEVEKIKKKANDLFNSFLSLMVSGEYEFNRSALCQMTDDLETVNKRIRQIVGQIDKINSTLPYDSFSAYYYKACLRITANGILSEGKKADSIAKAVDKAISIYNRGDQNVSALF